MSQICKGICIRYKAPTIPNALKYDAGYKRCTLCNEYFDTEKAICPCCTTRLRTRPRSKRLAKARV